jgi:hypothetical protein
MLKGVHGKQGIVRGASTCEQTDMRHEKLYLLQGVRCAIQKQPMQSSAFNSVAGLSVLPIALQGAWNSTIFFATTPVQAGLYTMRHYPDK